MAAANPDLMHLDFPLQIRPFTPCDPIVQLCTALPYLRFTIADRSFQLFCEVLKPDGQPKRIDGLSVFPFEKDTVIDVRDDGEGIVQLDTANIACITPDKYIVSFRYYDPTRFITYELDKPTMIYSLMNRHLNPLINSI